MKALEYSNIALIPKYNTLGSRKKADTSATLGSKVFALPIMPANMECVINQELAKFMSENDYFYVMHRFDVDLYNFVRRANEENWRTISISIGVNQKDYELIDQIVSSNYHVDYVTVDIAHGHSLKMREMLSYLKKHMAHCFVIAGNIATVDAVADLICWGANALKVGIGPGVSCVTFEKTGFRTPMFTVVKELANIANVPIIADGGVRSNGDIAKALVAGASWVMAGSLFATCSDSPAITLPSGEKQYYGSASTQCKGHSNNVEGKTIHIQDCGLTYAEKLAEIKQDLQSAITYAGGYDLSCFLTTEYHTV